jgi:hypothetical protein
MQIEEENHRFDGNNNLLVDGFRDKPAANAANATSIKSRKTSAPRHVALHDAGLIRALQPYGTLEAVVNSRALAHSRLSHPSAYRSQE